MAELDDHDDLAFDNDDPDVDNGVGLSPDSAAAPMDPAQGLESPSATDVASEQSELEAIKARVREMEEEAEKLKEMQTEVEKQMALSQSPAAANPLAMSPEEKLESDNRSVWVGNVDYGATAEELEAHFHSCGAVNRVTILCDKFTSHPKGFAYLEFGDKDSVQTALAMDDSLFRGRQIKVTPKRTNRPGISTTNRRPYRGGGGYFPRRRPSSYIGYLGSRPYRPRFRPRRPWYSPY